METNFCIPRGYHLVCYFIHRYLNNACYNKSHSLIGQSDLRKKDITHVRVNLPAYYISTVNGHADKTLPNEASPLTPGPNSRPRQMGQKTGKTCCHRFYYFLQAWVINMWKLNRKASCGIM